jgi:hypothetical protein
MYSTLVHTAYTKYILHITICMYTYTPNVSHTRTYYMYCTHDIRIPRTPHTPRAATPLCAVSVKKKKLQGDDTPSLCAASVNKSNKQKIQGGDTPLLCAVSGGHLSTIPLLLAAGADPRATNSKGVCALGSVASQVFFGFFLPPTPRPRTRKGQCCVALMAAGAYFFFPSGVRRGGTGADRCRS